MTKQIICIHVGDKYPDDYVLKLHSSCKRNIASEFVFTVISDRRTYGRDDIKIVPVGEDRYPQSRLWWHKMQAFDPSLAHDINLLIDIDVVITGSLDKFFEHRPGSFMICQDFNRQWHRAYTRCNSSVVRFDRDRGSSIWDAWRNTKDRSIGSYRGDQDWMDENILDKIWWPYAWAQSWKWEVYKGGRKAPHSEVYNSSTTTLDPECSILVFHGKPDPHEVNDPLITDCWVVSDRD